MACSLVAFCLHQIHMHGIVWVRGKQHLCALRPVKVRRRLCSHQLQYAAAMSVECFFPERRVQQNITPFLHWCEQPIFIRQHLSWRAGAGWACRSNSNGIAVISLGLQLDFEHKVQWWPVGRSLVVLVPVFLLIPLPALVLVTPCFSIGFSIHSAAQMDEWSMELRLVAAYLPAPWLGGNDSL